MKVKELIKLLQQEYIKGDNTVYIDEKDFTGFSVDDHNDVQLYPVANDKDA